MAQSNHASLNLGPNAPTAIKLNPGLVNPQFNRLF